MTAWEQVLAELARARQDIKELHVKVDALVLAAGPEARSRAAQGSAEEDDPQADGTAQDDAVTPVHATAGADPDGETIIPAAVPDSS